VLFFNFFLVPRKKPKKERKKSQFIFLQSLK